MSLFSLQQTYVCDNPAKMDFDLAGYMGMWYVQQQSSPPEATVAKACVSSNFHSHQKDNQNFNMQVTQVDVKPGVKQNYQVTDLNGYCSTLGECNAVNPAITMADGNPWVAVHRVIDTDYKTYSINYDCDADSGFPRVWILSRKKQLAKADQKKVNSTLKKLLPNFNGKLATVTQEGCNYSAKTFTPPKDDDSSSSSDEDGETSSDSSDDEGESLTKK